jgi:hypothetical protein
MLINLGGCKMYDNAQAASCRCVVKKKVYQKRRQVLSAFWAKHNNNKTEEDIDRVLAKYSKSTSSFAGLLLRLVRKYKKSIKVSKSEYENAMDELLRQARASGGARPRESYSSDSLRSSQSDERPGLQDDDGEKEEEEDEVIDLDASDEM